MDLMKLSIIRGYAPFLSMNCALDAFNRRIFLMKMIISILLIAMRIGKIKMQKGWTRLESSCEEILCKISSQNIITMRLIKLHNNNKHNNICQREMLRQLLQPSSRVELQ